MQRQVAIVVCGNAGTVGGEILRRRDVVTYWALNAEEAIATIVRVQPRVVLAREEQALAVIAGVKETKTPVVVLLDENGWDHHQEYIAAGAAAVALSQSGARILEAVSELTGLAFAKHPRVAYETTVEVAVVGKAAQNLATVNLSASGVCVAGLDKSDQGLAARVTFTRLNPPMSFDALVVRCFKGEGDKAMAGMTFTNVSPDAVAMLVTLVEDEIDKDETAALTVEVPLTLDPDEAALDEVQARGEAAVAALKDKLRGIHFDVKRDDELGGPRKPMPRTASTTSISAEVEPMLSPSERALVLGQPAPDWAEPVINARLRLHVERKQVGGASKRAVKEALTLCRTLGRGSTDAASMVEVTSVRASLLREVYCESPRSRHGAKEARSVEELLRRNAQKKSIDAGRGP